MLLVAILHEDDKPVRAWKGDACIYNAYRWANHHYCLADECYPIHKLPDWLKVTFHMATEEQFAELVK